ncbi:S8 family serine peptidase [Streptomyces gobiensis]|uniref:S8 family serine peptidase n=1 Tax=Streptomyces gobiensis TaxID=2875706 RepID=UPI001E3BA3CB|nr:S8 family serine peptidase [Streptomyces gobiensis]UGY93909.1 S8 family serine peptidase [Streptomyces gobiensis]
MSFTGMLRAVTGTLLTGTMLFSTGSAAVAADPPPDPRPEQWPLAAFAAEDIWEMSTGKDITVAVIDTGFRASHQDITNNMLPGKEFGDGEKNGVTRLDPGQGIRDHGTAMASLIAGHGHGPGNSKGIKGLAPEAKILPLSFEMHDSYGYRQQAKAIRYAVDRGAKVINMSYVLGDDLEVHKAINYAVQQDVVLIAGVGNDGSSEENYPAAYPGVIGVGAVDEDGKVWEDSNHNSNVDLLAPGVDIVHAGGKGDDHYQKASGTSDATAYASAAAALIRAKYPELTAGQVANRLVKSAGLPDDMKDAKLPDEYYGYGFIKPWSALKLDISVGPEQGPLPMPKSLDDGLPKPSTGDGPTPSILERGITLIAPFVLGAVVILVIVVLVIVMRSRRRRQADGYSAPEGASQPPPYPGQQIPGQAPPMPHAPRQQPTSPGTYPPGPPTQPPGQ